MGTVETPFTLLVLRRLAARLARFVSSTWSSLRQDSCH